MDSRRRAILAAGLSLYANRLFPQDTVKLTYYVTDLNLYRENLGAIGAAYREVFGRHYPAATLVEVSSLFDPAAMVEVDAVAVRQR